MSESPVDRLAKTLQDYTRWQLIQRLAQAEHDRNTAELALSTAQAKLKEAEERRREDVRKCWRLSLGHHVEAHPIFVSGADSIKTAFPDVFDEKERG